MAEQPKDIWFVYLLRCADGSLYTGIAKDVERRCRQHNLGAAARYTRCRRPVQVVYQERQTGRSSALKREAAIKAMRRRDKIALISNPAPAAPLPPSPCPPTTTADSA